MNRCKKTGRKRLIRLSAEQLWKKQGYGANRLNALHQWLTSELIKADGLQLNKAAAAHGVTNRSKQLAPHAPRRSRLLRKVVSGFGF